MSEDIRKLVTIRTIKSSDPIEGADAIESATVDGWSAVVKKGDFQVGDAVLYFEVDTALPTDVTEFSFLKGKKRIHPTLNKEMDVHVLKTIRLRGSLSQGLILPLPFGLTSSSTQEEIDEVMDLLGVYKYEAPVKDTTTQKGTFPSWIQKTDSERVQNLTDEFLRSLLPIEWFATIKEDGSSITVFRTEDGEFGFCSRNWELNPEGDSVFHRIVKKYNLEELIPPGIYIQGEVHGLGVQGNPQKLGDVRLSIFYTNYPPASEHDIYSEEGFEGLLDNIWVETLDIPLPATVAEAIEQADGILHPVTGLPAEGIVWHNIHDKKFKELGYRSTFKAVSNSYLLKH